jgi:hypothetical protein
VTRKEKIEWLVKAVEAVEGVKVPTYTFELMSDRQLDLEMQWYDYLLDK